MTHKDLTDGWREHVNDAAAFLVDDLRSDGQSLAIAREAFIAEFDRMAAQLDAA
jgi:hypothetical protein